MGSSLGAKLNTLWSRVVTSPNPYAGIQLSSSKASNVLQRMLMTVMYGLVPVASECRLMPGQGTRCSNHVHFRGELDERGGPLNAVAARGDCIIARLHCQVWLTVPESTQRGCRRSES
jgi:hypothetical protein